MDATLDAAGPGRPAATPTVTPPHTAPPADSPSPAHPRHGPGPAESGCAESGRAEVGLAGPCPAEAGRASGAPPRVGGVAPSGGVSADAGPARPAVTELRLSAFGPHRAAAFPLGPVTLFTGPSGSGKTQALDAYRALAALASGATLREAFPDPASRVPDRAVPDGGGRRGFRLGCTVDGPCGPVRLDLAVQAEPVLRIAGERLSQDGRILLTTALRDPRRRTLEAAWFTGGTVGVTRAPMPDDRLGTVLLPLRVAGSTAGQRRVLAAAEQAVVALRAVFACDPDPGRMRAPVPAGEGRLRTDCGNLADVLRRTRHECGTRHALLAGAARTGCAGPVAGLDVRAATGGAGLVAAVLDRGPGRPATGLDRLGAGELRFLALALVLLTGPGVLEVDPAAELLSARQALTVLADGLDRGLDRWQAAELLRLAVLSGGRGHIRLVAAVGEDTAGTGRGVPGVSVVDLSP
ncbi:ATP-binding protein [Streptomyces racemochromogenes]|uniref:ATP-binding protein n=1 Tax=Streptomyces racemochromogenes TaxID=67353 RepID=UPI0031EE3E1E